MEAWRNARLPDLASICKKRKLVLPCSRVKRVWIAIVEALIKRSNQAFGMYEALVLAAFPESYSRN